MFEKLDKIRGDLERAKQRRVEADVKVKALEEKLREAENSQVLADINALKLTPEQVAQFLQLAASGQLPMNGSVGELLPKGQHSTNSFIGLEEEDDMEDYEDEK